MKHRMSMVINSRVCGEAVVEDSLIEDDVRILENAKVSRSMLHGNVIVGGWADIINTEVSGSKTFYGGENTLVTYGRMLKLTEFLKRIDPRIAELLSKHPCRYRVRITNKIQDGTCKVFFGRTSQKSIAELEFEDGVTGVTDSYVTFSSYNCLPDWVYPDSADPDAGIVLGCKCCRDDISIYRYPNGRGKLEIGSWLGRKVSVNESDRPSLDDAYKQIGFRKSSFTYDTVCFNFDDESYGYVNTNTFEGFLRTWAGCYASEDIIDVIKQLLDTYTIKLVKSTLPRNKGAYCAITRNKALYNSLSAHDVLSMLDDPTVRAYVTRNEIVFIDGVLRKWICDKIRTNNLELVIHVDEKEVQSSGVFIVKRVGNVITVTGEGELYADDFGFVRTKSGDYTRTFKV